MRVTVLGSGTSTGVPMIGCNCRTCTSTDSRDKRLRVSVLIDTEDKRILIDTSADFRQQMLTHKVAKIDAILYTHHHYDHIAGFDDLRAFQFLHKRAPMCYAREDTFDAIKRTFAYAFGEALQSGGGLPQVPFTIFDDDSFVAAGITVTPIPAYHGHLQMVGFRVGDFAYLTDISKIPDESRERLHDLDVLILDGLRYQEHPTHLSINEAVQEVQKIKPKRTYLTHMNHDILHSQAEAKLPDDIRLAYDGLVIEL
jgi:phosphoribosyl 1,2-cyclic phosphate phosphodiesterase